MFIDVTDDISIGVHPEKKDIETITKLGFNSVIFLIEPVELSQKEYLVEEMILAQKGIKYFNVFVNKTECKDELIRKVSSLIKECSKKYNPLLICSQNGKKACIMTFLYLAIENGWSLGEYTDIAGKLGFNCEFEPEIKHFYESYIHKCSQGKH